MVYFGRISGGRVVTDETLRLPDGVVVRIEPVPDDADPADGLGDEAVETGITDLASEHDHYVYGTPKRSG